MTDIVEIYIFLNLSFIVALTSRSYRDCHCFFLFGNGTFNDILTLSSHTLDFPYPWQTSIWPCPK